jgi:site-specific recombinase XerD
VLERDFGWLDDAVRAKRPKRIPVVFSHAESTAILDRMRGVNWLVCKLLYGSGLRGIESLRVRVKDLGFDRLQITVRDAIRTVQELLGHNDVKTTQNCTHVLNQNAWAIRSPADDV